MIRYIQTLPSKLGRITSGGKLIKEIDGLRFIAIMPVLVQHLSERFERSSNIAFAVKPDHDFFGFLASKGFLGVYIFFVISGFILALPFAMHKLQGAKGVKLGAYYWRRITRLEPPYILWMTIFFLIYVLYYNKSILTYLPHYLANITYTHALIYKNWSLFNPPTWTLEIEVQFYIIAPFLASLCFSIKNKILRRATNIALILAIMLVQQQFSLFNNYFGLTILGHLHYFLIGFILADIFICEWSTVIKKSLIYDFTALGALSLLVLLWNWDFNFVSRISVVVMLFTLVYSCFKGNYVNMFVSNKWIMAIGGMCYTIYLVHLPFAELFITFTKDLKFTNLYAVNLLLQLFMYIPLVLILCSIFYLLFEKPFMNKEWPKVFVANWNKPLKAIKIKYNFYRNLN